MDFKGDKIRNIASFGGEVKPSARVVRFYGMLKIPSGMIEILIGKIQSLFIAQFIPSSQLGVCCIQSRELWWTNQKWLELR
jgi:hypothetical protein